MDGKKSTNMLRYDSYPSKSSLNSTRIFSRISVEKNGEISSRRIPTELIPFRQPARMLCASASLLKIVMLPAPPEFAASVRV